MATVKRSVLKEIVKECLLEILFEGIDSEPGYEEEEPIREARRPKRRATRPSQKRNVRPEKTERVQSTKRKKLHEDFVHSAVGELTQDPMMASIFADTAQTTLQEQREGRRPPSDTASAIVDNAEDLETIFEGAGNWAAIAFPDGDK
mgnify:CR=1 FL=1